MKIFFPKLYFWNIWMFYFVGFIFLSVAVFAKNGWVNNGRIKLLIFCVIWFLLLFIRSFVPGMSYVVKSDRIILRSLWFWRYSISFNIITDIRKISQNELELFLEKSWMPTNISKARDADVKYIPTFQEIRKELKNRKRYGWLVAYCSVPIVRSGNKFKVPSKNDFVLITLTDGRQHIISPKDINGFLTEVKKYDASMAAMV